jgi:hypothetical protein
VVHYVGEGELFKDKAYGCADKAWHFSAIGVLEGVGDAFRPVVAFFDNSRVAFRYAFRDGCAQGAEDGNKIGVDYFDSIDEEIFVGKKEGGDAGSGGYKDKQHKEDDDPRGYCYLKERGYTEADTNEVGDQKQEYQYEGQDNNFQSLSGGVCQGAEGRFCFVTHFCFCLCFCL